MVESRLTKLTCSVVLALVLFVTGALAVPPSPESVEQWKADGTLEENLAIWRKIDPPHYSDDLTAKPTFKLSADATADAPDTLQLIVILIDFFDHPASIGDSAKFDSLLFSEGVVPTGSMTDYYLENSYGKVFIKGDVYGWFRADKSYDYYVGLTSGQYAGELAANAVWKADSSGVDFRKYTGGVAGFHTGLVIIHAGCGAEACSPAADHIWSHQSSLPTTVDPDSVYLTEYTMQPEIYQGGLTTMGVFCHEYGHILGLPDYYDTDYDPPGSEGLGSWAVMAGGSWNGPRGGEQPSHFCAYSKIFLGYVEPIYVFDTASDGSHSIIQAPIPQVESEPVIYKIKNQTKSFYEYWLVENRQKVGFDASLPGEGLAIYHFDIRVANNGNPDRYRNCLEEADGDWSLRYDGVRGESGDLWPGSTNNRDFMDFSWPNSRYNEIDALSDDPDSVSEVGVWNISDSDSLMFADLESRFTHPWPALIVSDSLRFSDAAPGGNGDGIMDAGETISFFFRVTNLMGQSFRPFGRLTVDHPDVIWVTQEVTFGASLGTVLDYYGNELGSSEPIVFTLPADMEAANVTFTLTIESDAAYYPERVGDFSTSFDFEEVFGIPSVLVVDDDNGADLSVSYKSGISGVGLAYRTWNKTGGSPSAADLTPYSTVVWHTGDPVAGGCLNVADVTALRGFLDGGGNLLLSSIHAVDSVSDFDSAFVRDYLHCSKIRDQFSMGLNGVDGQPLSEGTFYRFNVPFQSNLDHLEVYPPAQSAFTGFMTGTHCLTYSGDYQLVLMTLPIEFIGDNYMGGNTRDTLLGRVFAFFDGTLTSIDDGITQTGLPGAFALSQNYPNPFNPATQISYTIPAGGSTGDARTQLVVYNVLGQDVKTLVDKVQAPGTYTVDWDGKNRAGDKVSSGMYMYRLVYGDLSETRKMVLVK